MVAVIADNTVLSNFALIEREDILDKVFGGAICTTAAVRAELSEGEKRGLVPRRDWSKVPVLSVESTQERQAFDIFSARLGKGEASCLSLAICRNLRVLTDDRDTRIIAHRRNISVSGTIGVLVLAVKRNILTRQAANLLLSRLIEKGYYSPYQSLDGLI